jgi:hypothetical protein
VEKIPFIHNPDRVYYHYYPFFLSKLTKEGKLSRLRQGCSRPTAHGHAGMTHTPFCLQKKKAEQAFVATTTPAMTQLFDRGISSRRFNVRQTLLNIHLVFRKNGTHPP